VNFKTVWTGARALRERAEQILVHRLVGLI
jgi:hypothetical protein